MKKFFLFAPALIFIFFSCKNLPVIESVKQPGMHSRIIPFLTEKYQLTHSIKAELPNGDRLLVMGVTVADPADRSIRALMMTVEGLVLFDVEYKNNAVIVNRAIPNFKSSDFTRALIDDLKLIYFVPHGGLAERGISEGSDVTRYSCKDGTTVDVIAEEGGQMKINKYDRNNSLIRIVDIFLMKEQLPEKFELTAPGIFGYSLYMELVNAERL
ncbi:MAG: hypothetical protein JXN64_12685 [Spirochaetes bacterium]|nr:hypothetical protein [Spirochaetota bacterium]